MVSEDLTKLEDNNDVYETFGADFGAPEYTVSDDDDKSTIGSFVNPEYDEEQHLKKAKIKADLWNAGISFAINSIPTIVDYCRAKKNGQPFVPKRSEVVRIVVATAVPTLMVADNMFMGGKIQEKVPLSDIRNVVNLVSAYKPTHSVIRNALENTVRSSNGKAKIEISPDYGRNMAFGIANVISPYVVGKMTDSRLTLSEKLGSMLPIPILGQLVKQLFSMTPATQQVYSVGTALMRTAATATREMGTAVRANNGSTMNKNFGAVQGVLDIMMDATGVPHAGRSTLNGYGGYYNDPYNFRRANDWGGSRQPYMTF